MSSIIERNELLIDLIEGSDLPEDVKEMARDLRAVDQPNDQRGNDNQTVVQLTQALAAANESYKTLEAAYKTVTYQHAESERTRAVLAHNNQQHASANYETAALVKDELARVKDELARVKANHEQEKKQWIEDVNGQFDRVKTEFERTKKELAHAKEELRRTAPTDAEHAVTKQELDTLKALYEVMLDNIERTKSGYIKMVKENTTLKDQLAASDSLYSDLVKKVKSAEYHTSLVIGLNPNETELSKQVERLHTENARLQVRIAATSSFNAELVGHSRRGGVANLNDKAIEAMMNRFDSMLDAAVKKVTTPTQRTSSALALDMLRDYRVGLIADLDVVMTQLEFSNESADETW